MEDILKSFERFAFDIVVNILNDSVYVRKN